MSKGIFLSVDFDLFTREDTNWDWGHRETTSGALEQILWHSRLSMFAFAGIDPIAATDPEVHSPLRPKTFWDVLERSGLDVRDATLHVADSHMYGALSHRLDDRSVVHIDAHHDLGYQEVAGLRKTLKAQRADCGNWLLHVLHRNKRVRTEQYISPWGSPEGSWDQIPTVQKRVKQTLLGTEPIESLPGLSLTGKVDTVFIARSGAWVPPWWDDLFVSFVRDGEVRTGSKPYVLDEHTDPLKTRGVSLSQAREMYEKSREQWKAMNAPRPQALV